MWERFLARGTSPENFAQLACVVWKMLQNRRGIVGASCTFRGQLALSEGTFLRHREIGSCVFSKYLYGDSWGGMRSAHKISSQSEVIWQVNPRFEKTAKVWRLLAEFHIGMAVDVVLQLG